MDNNTENQNMTRRNFLHLLAGSIWSFILTSCNLQKTPPTPTNQSTLPSTPESTKTPNPTATKNIPTSTATQTITPTSTTSYCEDGILVDLDKLVTSLADLNILYKNEKGDHPSSNGTLYMDVGDWKVEINNQLLGYLEQCNLELVLLEKVDNEYRVFEITNLDENLILNTRLAPFLGPNQGEGEYSIAFTGGIGRDFYLGVSIKKEWIMIEGSEIAFGFMVVNHTKTPGKNGGSTSDTSNGTSTNATNEINNIMQG